MYTAIGYAAQSATTPLAPMTFQRRSPRPDDVPSRFSTAACATPISTRPATNGASPFTR